MFSSDEVAKGLAQFGEATAYAASSHIPDSFVTEEWGEQTIVTHKSLDLIDKALAYELAAHASTPDEIRKRLDKYYGTSYNSGKEAAIEEGAKVKTVQEVRHQYVIDGDWNKFLHDLDEAANHFGIHDEDFLWRRTEAQVEAWRKKQDMYSQTNWILRTKIMK